MEKIEFDEKRIPVRLDAATRKRVQDMANAEGLLPWVVALREGIVTPEEEAASWQ